MMAQVVEAHPARDGQRHQLAAALGEAGAFLADAAGAVALHIVGVVLFAVAPAANMTPSRDDARAAQRATKHVAHRSVLAEHLSVGSGKNEVAPRLVKSALEVRHELGGDGDRFLVCALGAPVVAAAHGEQSPAQVDIVPAQADQLALPQAGVDGGREEGPPALGDLLENGCDLVRLEEGRLTLRNAPELDVDQRVSSRAAASAATSIPGGADHPAELIE